MMARALNQEGMSLFLNHLRSIRTGTEDESRIRRLRDDHGYSQAFYPEIEFESRNFDTKKELATYVCGQYAASGLSTLPADPGLWSWLAVFYFETLRPRTGRRSQAIREDARYVYNPAYNRAYRHRIAGPARALWAHRGEPESVDILLYGRPFELSDFEEQILSRQQRIQNRAVVALSTRLHFDPTTGRAKRSAGNDANTPGSLHRLLRVLEQFELTRDLYSMSIDELLEMLPEEFDRWKE